jgi:hypothetical protein
MKLRLWGSVPLKGLCPAGASEVPTWFSVGPASDALKKFVRVDILGEVVSSGFSDLTKALRSRGIVPEFPRELGGFGLWWAKTSPRACKRARKAAAMYAFGSADETVSTFSKVFATSFSPALRQILSELEVYLRLSWISYRESYKGAPSPPVPTEWSVPAGFQRCWPAFSDFVLEVASFLARTTVDKPSESRPFLSAIVSALKKRFEPGKLKGLRRWDNALERLRIRRKASYCVPTYCPYFKPGNEKDLLRWEPGGAFSPASNRFASQLWHETVYSSSTPELPRILPEFVARSLY